jgi:hypothetical protein
MQNGKAATIHHRMAFSLRFEDNAGRRQRLRLAQQSRKRRARETDASPHHLEPSDHQFASVSAMAASAMPSSRTLGLLLPYLTPRCCRAFGTHAATTSP